MVTEPEKCPNLQLASWRLRWVNGTVLFDVQGLRTRRAATQTSRKKYTYDSRPKKSQLTHQDQRQEKTNVSARVTRQDDSLSLFSRLEEGQFHQEDNLLYKSTDSNINLFQKWPHNTPKVTSDQMHGYPIALSP